MKKRVFENQLRVSDMHAGEYLDLEDFETWVEATMVRFLKKTENEPHTEKKKTVPRPKPIISAKRKEKRKRKTGFSAAETRQSPLEQGAAVPE